MKADTWMPIYWGDYAKDTGHLGAVHHGAYLMLIKHYWTQAAPLPNDDNQLWRIACVDSLAQWRKIKPIVLAFFDSNDGLLRHGRVDEELAKAEGNVERRAEMARRAAGARWGPERSERTLTRDTDGEKSGTAEIDATDCQGIDKHGNRYAPRNARRMPGAMRGACPPPSSSDESHGEIQNDAARASAGPKGPPRTRLPDTAKWAERLANHKPLEGKPCWTGAWGLSPDSAGHNPLIPPRLYRAWRDEYDRELAALKQRNPA